MSGYLRPVRRKIILFSCVSLALAGVIAWRFYVLQIRRHDELLEKAKKRYTATEVIKGQRGRIYDADGNLLVGNMPRVAMTCSPYSAVHEPFSHLEKSLRPGVRESLPARREERRRLLARLLAENFGGSEAEYYELLAPFIVRKDASGRPRTDESGAVLMRRNHFLRVAPRFVHGREVVPAASAEQIANFRSALAAHRISTGGFSFQNIYVRRYPKGRMLSNVLGYANIGMDGTSELGGLEQKLGRDMRQEERVVRYEKAASGAQLSELTIEEKGRDGNDLFLTVREPVQAILEEELDAAMAEFPVESIYAVIADPRTGDILAISQRPNFNPGDPKTINDAALTARFAVNGYEPGSVMKPFTIGKALDWGVITSDTVIDCGSDRTWIYAGKALKDFRGYGKMNPGGILKKSSNIGTAKVALLMGDERVMRMLRTFKYGVPTGLPFASETRGQLPKYPFPDKLTVTRAPIGYAVQVSILQLVRAYCALANGGMMPELRLIDRRRNAETGEVTVEPCKPMTPTFEHPELVKDLVEMLISVTSPGGTATKAAIPGYEVAGKTGTSQKLTRDPATGKRYYGTEYCATFAGFVPARNPRLVMVITFDRVSGARHGGGNVAAPVFGRTMRRVLQVLNIPPDFPDKLEK